MMNNSFRTYVLFQPFDFILLCDNYLKPYMV